MTPFVTAGAGFLAAVLWFDLMFDVQALRTSDRARDFPETALASIAGYYRRVTTDARPMSLLVVAAMIWTATSIVVQLARGDSAWWVGPVCLALAGSAIVVAKARTVPAAVRLGRRADGVEQQRRLARSIGREHVACLAAITSLLVIQLGWGH